MKRRVAWGGRGSGAGKGHREEWLAGVTVHISLRGQVGKTKRIRPKSKSPVRARRSHDHVMHLINVRQNKLRLAPPLWFRAINTFRDETVKMQTCIWLVKRILAGSIIY